jgi:inner membrane protein
MLPFDTLPKPQDAEEHACVRVSRGTANVQALLRFAKRVYVKWQAQQDGGFLVTWTDLRFWRDKDWPFRAEVRLDDKLNVVEQRIGWHKKAWEPPYV